MSEGNTWAGWIEAFGIFARYTPEGRAEIDAQHDVIAAGPDPARVSAADRARLEELGWSPMDEWWEKFT